MVDTTHSFYQVFINEILNHKFQADSRIRDTKFRKFIIQTEGKTLSTVSLLRNSLATTIQKPQRCLYADKDWYLAIDTYTSTFYVCYQQLMMVDIDYGKGNQYTTPEQIIDMLTEYTVNNPEVLMEVFQSGKGVHAFLVHKPYDYHCQNSLQVMLNLGCDFYYVIYASLRGWSVRVNAKIGEQVPIYTKLATLGTGVADPHLSRLVNLHLNFLPTFANVTESKMW
jgi:hypothetical protein